MIARRALTTQREELPALPPAAPSAWDRDHVMLELAARGQSLRALPPSAARLVRVGEDARQFLLDDVPVSAPSFAGVCAALDVPPAFLRRAPFDLAQEVVAGMLRDPRVEEREIIFNAATSAVVGHRPRGRQMVPAADVFERLFDKLPDADGIYFHQTDASVEASVVCKSLDVEPKRGDVVRGGLSCLYSEVGAKRTTIRAYSERLVCTNGMTHREFERTFGLPDGLSTFLDEIGIATERCLEHVRQSLEPKMRRASEFEVNGPQAIRRIFKQARLSPAHLDAVLAAHAVEDDGTMFGVLQAFTRAANTLHHDARARLQVVAGDELLVVERAHCPTCYASM